MNRDKVIIDDIPNNQIKKKKFINNRPSNNNDDEFTLKDIIKFSQDKKNIKSDLKRKRITREMFIEYMLVNYNADLSD